MDPKDIPYPKVMMTSKELEDKRGEYEEILSVVQFFSQKVLDSLKGTPLLLAVSDEEGFILHMMGDETIKNTINQLGIRPGVQFTEQAMGTNVVSLSLKHSGLPIQVIGADHYHECLHQIACYAVAFHYTDIGDLLGSLIIMTSVEYQNPLMVTMLSITVDSIERELLLRKQNRQLNIMNQIMMENATNGIIITDKEGRITGFNRTAQSFTGLSKELALCRSVLYLSPMDHYIYDVIQHGKNTKTSRSVLNKRTRTPVLSVYLMLSPFTTNRNISLEHLDNFAILRNVLKRKKGTTTWPTMTI
ncbi:PAS domain-containing protein [Brevibacillus massiliensis]|uniref:PAS domain-containing protein n=1 Tax=Brevibacillus massiliensis TaxID=1118054 RepID=UPI0028FCF4E2|nr:PAS domain-containing protein [Brevibacillus massiliensis]